MDKPEHILPMLRRLSEQESPAVTGAEFLREQMDEAEAQALKKIQARENPYLTRTEITVVPIPDVQPPITPEEILNQLTGDTKNSAMHEILLGTAVLPTYIATIFVVEGEEIELKADTSAAERDALPAPNNKAEPGTSFVFRVTEAITPNKPTDSQMLQHAVNEITKQRTNQS